MMKGALMAKEQGRRKILFLCTGNSARSIFAEYFMNRTGKNRFEAYSAGSQPAGTVNPFALRILQHMYNIDPSQARSKSWDEFKDLSFDFVITVCDSARESCPIFPGQPIVAHWGIPDPALATGNDEEKLRRFRDAALQIQRRIDLFCALPIEKLERLNLTKLVQEIGDKERTKEEESHGRANESPPGTHRERA
jgi:arsenate reductase (thioredoxin)